MGTRTQEGFSSHTIRAYRLQHQIPIREVGDVGLAAVTLDLLRTYLTHHGHLKSSSLGHKIRAIKGLFRWAEDEGICVPSPARKLTEPKLGQRVPKALTMDELEWLRDAYRTTLEHAVVEFLFATGCRVGEAERLNRRDVDWQRGSVVVVGKGNKEREVYLGSKARIWLTRYFAERQDADPALWVTERAAHRLSIHGLQGVFTRVTGRCGLAEKVHPHTMRHTLDTTLLNQGGPWWRCNPSWVMRNPKRPSSTPY